MALTFSLGIIVSVFEYAFLLPSLLPLLWHN
jgi:hypothetical protein